MDFTDFHGFSRIGEALHMSCAKAGLVAVSPSPKKRRKTGSRASQSESGDVSPQSKDKFVWIMAVRKLAMNMRVRDLSTIPNFYPLIYADSR